MQHNILLAFFLWTASNFIVVLSNSVKKREENNRDFSWEQQKHLYCFFLYYYLMSILGLLEYQKFECKDLKPEKQGLDKDSIKQV